MNRVIIAGIGMTVFGKHLGRDVRSLAIEAADAAIDEPERTLPTSSGSISGTRSPGLLPSGR